MRDMTDAEIDALTGRELDAAVCRHIWGTNPETDISAWSTKEQPMLDLLARMEAQGWREITLYRYERGESMFWEAEFQQHEGALSYAAVARTLPEAVCRAAIKAALSERGEKR